MQYQNNRVPFNLEGILYQSHLYNENVLIEFQNTLENEFEVVYSSILNHTDQEHLFLKPKDVKAFDSVFVITFFNHTKRDLVTFEFDYKLLGLKNVYGTEFELDDNVLDVWYHKVVEGEYIEEKKQEEPKFSILSVNNPNHANIAVTYLYKDPWNRGYDEEHSKYGRLNLVGSSIMGDTHTLYSTVQITGQSIILVYPDGRRLSTSGNSQIWFGQFNNPISISIVTATGTTGIRDFIKESRFYSNGALKNTSGTISLDFSYGVGPLSATVNIWSSTNKSTAVPDIDGTPTYATLYHGGTNYPGNSVINFNNYRLHTVDSFLYTGIKLGVNTATSTTNGKRITAHARVPIYVNGNGTTLLRTNNYETSISYRNQ